VALDDEPVRFGGRVGFCNVGFSLRLWLRRSEERSLPHVAHEQIFYGQ
jgi:hypothetical protein